MTGPAGPGPMPRSRRRGGSCPATAAKAAASRRPNPQPLHDHKRNLSSHILSQHGGSTPEVCCPICKVKTFKSEASLRDHRSK